jgi:hypothetical protein
MTGRSRQRDWTAASCYPRPLSVCLAARLERVGKMLLTDLCNRLTARALANRSISGRAACAAPTASCDFITAEAVLIDRTRAAPDRLSTTQPRLGPRLTARDSSFGPIGTVPPSPLEEAPGVRPKAVPPRRGVFDRMRS